MKLFISSLFALIILHGADFLSALTVSQPGQLASTASTAALLANETAAMSYPNVMPKTDIAVVEDRHDKLMNRLWIASIFASVAGTSFDAASSWGGRESNSLLASSDGSFGAKGLGIKAGVAAAVIIPQICLRKRKDLRAIFTAGNFGQATIFTGAGIHNLRVR